MEALKNDKSNLISQAEIQAQECRAQTAIVQSVLKLLDGVKDYDDVAGAIKAKFEAKDKEIERLRVALKTIQIASEFHSQEGLADYVMRYAHESTFRLATQALGGNDE